VECSACLSPSDGRYEWTGVLTPEARAPRDLSPAASGESLRSGETLRSYPLCRDCHPVPEAPWKPLKARDAADLRKRIAQKAELVRPAVEELLGIPYADLGPPRRVEGWDGYDREIARQDRLVEAGLLRRGRSTLGEPATLGWGRFSDGRFGWYGNNCGIPGGTWPSPDDYEKAWEASRQPVAWRRRRVSSPSDILGFDDLIGDDNAFFNDLL